MTNSARQSESEDASHVDNELTGYIGYNLKRVLSLVHADLTQVLGTLDLRVVSFSVLSIVVRNPGINQTQLAEALKIERSNLVQLIDELSGKSLLARTPVAGDRRRYALMPTTTGKALYAKAEKAVAAHEARIFAMLDGAEQANLIALLRKVRMEWPG
jgi:DNA-binding MarR family transcriptional regulator